MELINNYLLFCGGFTTSLTYINFCIAFHFSCTFAHVLLHCIMKKVESKFFNFFIYILLCKCLQFLVFLGSNS